MIRRMAAQVRLEQTMFLHPNMYFPFEWSACLVSFAGSYFYCSNNKCLILFLKGFSRHEQRNSFIQQLAEGKMKYILRHSKV